MAGKSLGARAYAVVGDTPLPACTGSTKLVAPETYRCQCRVVLECPGKVTQACIFDLIAGKVDRSEGCV